eukprot:CAMPEP_0196573038 /NCGR_PEP_ID=MMETSP1081-20130531/3011_1 /TAXON_ID=36882 /ORGANISM="Pyramimonas amylifera, Strain CCMP720" /LENGTH=305 /DNA_ID=CAMNT_0041890601 /DNA_START=191 /DNA_END=1108 /DNA_ORIENTATION=-
MTANTKHIVSHTVKFLGCNNKFFGKRNNSIARSNGRTQVAVTAAQDVEELPANLRKIVMSFQMVPDAMMRYKQLLFYASKLKPMAAELHSPENKVQGCVSQVWVFPSWRDGKVFFEADSDSQLTKGLAALLVEGLSGSTPTEILRVSPDFVDALGLKQSLTPSRNNGFLNMLLLMQKKTLELYNEQEKEQVSEVKGPSSSEEEKPEDEECEFPVARNIRRKIEEALGANVELVIDDQSSQHAGHSGTKGLRPTETHLSLEIVSAEFEGKNTMKRHRLIYQILADELANGVHALSLSTKTPDEAES